MLTFTDSTGETWQVWMTTPTNRTVVATALANGWLTFESTSGARRRLAPVPRSWDSCGPTQLELMCRAAEPARET